MGKMFSLNWVDFFSPKFAHTSSSARVRQQIDRARCIKARWGGRVRTRDGPKMVFPLISERLCEKIWSWCMFLESETREDLVRVDLRVSLWWIFWCRAWWIFFLLLSEKILSFVLIKKKDISKSFQNIYLPFPSLDSFVIYGIFFLNIRNRFWK